MHGIMRFVLHVTNGDSAAAALARAGFEDALPWRDVLHEGPVPLGSPQELRRVRARFLADAHGVEEAAVLRELEDRDARLYEAEQITLWFESDLYDDLQRMQISHQLEPDQHVVLVLIDELPWRGVAELSAVELRAAYERAVRVPDLRAQWDAVRDPDPRGVTHPRYRQEFPWTTDGLSRSERQLRQTGGDFTAAQAMEERPFLGDTTAARIFERAKDAQRTYELGGATATDWRYDPTTRELRPASGP